MMLYTYYADRYYSGLLNILVFLTGLVIRKMSGASASDNAGMVLILSPVHTRAFTGRLASNF